MSLLWSHAEIYITTDGKFKFAQLFQKLFSQHINTTFVFLPLAKGIKLKCATLVTSEFKLLTIINNFRYNSPFTYRKKTVPTVSSLIILLTCTYRSIYFNKLN
jgi:hypothetical protein